MPKISRENLLLVFKYSMRAKIIDGCSLAEKVKEDIRSEVLKMSFKPGLAMIMVGEDPASRSYLVSKEKTCSLVGFYSRQVVLPAKTKQDQLVREIGKLNRDPKIHGILVQLPLPKSFDQNLVFKSIDPRKDVDCLNPVNLGNLFLAKEAKTEDFLAPCTPKGIIKLIESTGFSLEGKKAVIVGRSVLVGKPLVHLLLSRNATVTVCHSKTKDLEKETFRADVLISAVGHPGLITAKMVAKGALVIDVGINRFGGKIVGDVDFGRVIQVAGFITPVPGGVGPMTIASLLENTLLLAKKIGN